MIYTVNKSTLSKNLTLNAKSHVFAKPLKAVGDPLREKMEFVTGKPVEHR